MKRIIAIVLLLSTFASCTDMLEQYDPTGPTGLDFFKTENDVDLALTAAYAGLSLRFSLYYQDMLGFEQFSDNIYTGASITDGEIGPWSVFQHTPTNGGVTSTYRDLYRAITRANQVIKNAPGVEGISTENLNNYMGQAYFLRGFEYFLLTLMFGDTPIVLEPSTDPAGFNVPASHAADVYNQAVADLQMAEQLLPGVASQGGRVIKWTAKAMLAKVYLFGADELGNSSWYALSKQKAKEVIDAQVYALYNDPLKTPEENFIDVFLLENENGTEDIFAVQHYNDGGQWSNFDTGSQIPISILPRFNRGPKVWGYGWGYVYESVLKRWSPDDARKSVTLFEDGEDIIINGAVKGQYNQSAQARPGARPKGGGVQKFWWAENFKTVNGISDFNFKVLRYAELLLIHAEADFLDDSSISAEGLASLNEVRQRAGLGDLAASDITREKILDERRWELFGECHRWFDLVRTHTAEAAFAIIAQDDTDGDDASDQSGFVGAKYYKLPYPQSALERNPSLVQKPEWAAATEGN